MTNTWYPTIHWVTSRKDLRTIVGNPAIPRPEFRVQKSVKNSAKIATLKPLESLTQPSPRSATKQFPFRFEVPFWRIIYKLICNITNARLAQWLCLLFLIMSFRRWGFKSWFRHSFLINILLLSRESSWPPDGHYLKIQFWKFGWHKEAQNLKFVWPTFTHNVLMGGGREEESCCGTMSNNKY